MVSILYPAEFLMVSFLRLLELSPRFAELRLSLVKLRLQITQLLLHLAEFVIAWVDSSSVCSVYGSSLGW